MAKYDAEFWEQHYRTLDPAWGTSPNRTMIDTISMMFPGPGAALELGAGHGGDALWLAREGWTVTALDVAQTALDRIAAHAAEQGLSERVRTIRRDATTEPLPAHPTPEQVAEALDLGSAWNAEILDIRRRLATGPGGQRAEVADTIVALRRKAA